MYMCTHTTPLVVTHTVCLCVKILKIKKESEMCHLDMELYKHNLDS